MKSILTVVLLAGLTAGALTVRADDKANDKKVKPYPLKTCIVSDEEIDEKGPMKPYAFVYKDQQVRLCCKACLKDFNKEPAKYLKKIEDAGKKK